MPRTIARFTRPEGFTDYRVTFTRTSSLDPAETYTDSTMVRVKDGDDVIATAKRRIFFPDIEVTGYHAEDAVEVDLPEGLYQAGGWNGEYAEVRMEQGSNAVEFLANAAALLRHNGWTVEEETNDHHGTEIRMLFATSNHWTDGTIHVAASKRDEKGSRWRFHQVTVHRVASKDVKESRISRAAGTIQTYGRKVR